MKDKTVLPGGDIQAQVEIVSKTTLTYGMSFALKEGSAAGAVIDELLDEKTASIPLVGQRTLSLGTITFSPDAVLTIHLNKFGVYQNEGLYIGVFDTATAIAHFYGLGDLAAGQQEFETGSIDAALSLVSLLTGAGFDSAGFAEQFSRLDYDGVFKTFGQMMVATPADFSDFLLSIYDITVSPVDISELGKLLIQGLPVASLRPMVYDYLQRPGEVQVDILGINQGANVDVILTIDTSDSMYPECLCYPDNPDGEDRIGAAKTAAKTFIDQMRGGDSVGVVSFGAQAVTNYALTPVTTESRMAAKNGVDAIYSIDSTSIGAGLRAAFDNYQAHGNPENAHSILLISDGYENYAPYASSVIPDLQNSQIAVYSIGLGNTADAKLLQTIATSTGGTYTFSPTPADLAAIYNRLAGKISGKQMVISGEDAISPGITGTKTALIGTREATFTVTWDDPAIEAGVTLIDPSGRVIDSSTPGSDSSVTHFTGPGITSYRITGPETGAWTLQIYSPADAGGDLHYFYSVNELTDLRMDVYANANLILPGEPIMVYAMLYNDQGLVSGADVTARVEPAGGLIELVDDGTSGDAASSDGIYTGRYENTAAAGNYKFLVDASRDDFTRQADITVVAALHLPQETDIWAVYHDGPPTLTSSGTVNFNIVYGNGGPNSIRDITVLETIPGGFTLESSSLGAPEKTADNRVYWKIDSLAAHTFESFSITLKKNTDFVFGGTVNNRLNIYPLNRGSDANVENNLLQMPVYRIYTSAMPVILR